MHIDEWKAITLTRLGLTRPMTTHEICRRHNGVQAQFQTYADEGFKSRLRPEEWASDWSRDLVRQWSLRGTIHAYLKEEIPLYLYKGRNQGWWLDYLSKHGGATREEEEHYAHLIEDSLRSGNKTRDELKAICRSAGLQPEQEKHYFSAWGGLLAAMVFDGRIYQEYGRRSFGRLERYEPWERDAAQLEIARRYFSGFGPVSIRDARYYFKTTKSRIEGWMSRLDLNTVEVGGTRRYYIGDLPVPDEIPEALFIAGFDALLLAFEKRENPFFDPKFLREIYTMTGIIKPTLLLRGSLAATWRKEKGSVFVKPFRSLTKKDIQRIERTAFKRFDTQKIHWE